VLRSATRLVASLSALSALSALTACVDRPLEPVACGDGVLSPGEVCFDKLGTPLQPGLMLHAMRVGDFDGDAHADVVALGIMANGAVGAELWRGDGAGGLAPAPVDVYGCSAHPIEGFVDSDDTMDLLLDECGPSVVVFLGDSTGFVQPTSIVTGANTKTGGLADVDGDGDTDVLIVGADDLDARSINVALGDGQMGFAPPVVSPIGAPNPAFAPIGVMLGDLDEDGAVDGILLDPRPGVEGGGLAIAWGLGGGAFSPATAMLAGLPEGSPTLRDFDHDGHLDLVIRVTEPAQLVFARGDGTGTFAETSKTELTAGVVLAIARGDIDDDGNDDMVFVRPDDSTVETWLGDAGEFDGPNATVIAGAPEQIGIADFNEDGAPDLVLGQISEGRIRLLLADP
jgi:hypothetical protein